MYLKKLIPLAIAVLFTTAVTAQGFMRSVPKPKGLAELRAKKQGRSLTGFDLDQAAIVTVKNEFRPVANIASYLIGKDVKEASILTGAGVGYERLSYSAETDKWKIVWSINGLIYGRISLSDQNNGKKLMYGISLGAFDNLIMVGGATDGINGYGTIGIGIPLNNL